ncbi:MAG: CPBP family intramembrane metalloprotease [Bacteroidia bacterium]|nr:CPBP family intramembrane metalloprotease [Bacteroidia bacterium]
MDNTEHDISKKELPFNNLFLNSAVVHGLNYWWMYVMGICAAALGYIICQLIISFPLMAFALNNGNTFTDIQNNPTILFDATHLGINKNILLAFLLAMFAFALLGLFIVVKKVHHKTLISVITAYNKLRYKRIFFAFLVWAILITIITIAAYFISPENVVVQFDPLNFLLLVIVSALLMPIQTSTEEILIRGYLMQGIALIFRNGIAPLIITSVFFGLLHMDNPEAKAYGWWVMLPYYSVFGAFLGMLTLLDEGLELALGIHFANNFISSLLVTSPTGVLKTDAIFLVKSDDPGVEFVIFIILALITFFIFWRKYRWTNFKLILK